LSNSLNIIHQQIHDRDEKESNVNENDNENDELVEESKYADEESNSNKLLPTTGN
jgi:hypothetical protein